MVLLPRDWVLCSNERWKPLINAIMPITVPTPMTMPSNASIDRSRFAANARPAISRISRTRLGVTASLVAQRLDRVEAGRAKRGVRAEEHADQRRHHDPREHGGQADLGRQ